MQYDGVALGCLFFVLRCNIVVMCHGFVTTELVSRQDGYVTRTLGVLDVDGQQGRFNVKNTHTAV